MPVGNKVFPAHMGSSLWKSAATALVYKETFGGIQYIIAVDGTTHTVISWGIIDDIVINATVIYVNALGGGEVYVEQEDYNLTATVNVLAYVFLRGAGWATIFNYNAAGNCITITGDNVKLRDFKIVIVVGAGAAGTRPNGVYATDRTNVEISFLWVYGDSVNPGDASALRQSGIVFELNMTYSKIAFCMIENFERNGIILGGTLGNEHTHIEIEGNILNTLINTAILLTYADSCTLTGNICTLSLVNNIALNNCDGNTITGNFCEGGGGSGIYLLTTVNTPVSGNTCNGNGTYGIHLDASVDNTVTGNTCNGNSYHGIYLFAASDSNPLLGNTCQGNRRNGIQIEDSDDNTIVGNSCNENDSQDTGTYDGINITDISLDNIIHSNTCNNNDNYGINIDDVRSLRNWVKHNKLRGNTTGAFNDGGVDTATHEFTVYAPNQDAYVGATPSNHRGQQCLDNVTTQVPFEIHIPNEFQELVTAHVVYVTGANGIINRSVATDFGKVCAGEQIDAHSDSIAAGDIAGNTTDEFECDDVSAALTDIAFGDSIGMTWTNFGAAAGTIDATVWVIEVRIRYV